MSRILTCQSRCAFAAIAALSILFTIGSGPARAVEYEATLLKNIAPDPAGSSPNNFSEFNFEGISYFSADDAIDGQELWRSDGTEAGTFQVKDINDGPSPSYPLGFVELNGKLYFTASDEDFGLELWRTDGSSGGTERLTDINAGPASSEIYVLTVINGTIYFGAENGTSGVELWKTTGAPGAEEMIANINTNPGADSLPNGFTQVGGVVVFAANSGPPTGLEPWVTDGAAGPGTHELLDIKPGTGNSAPNGFFEFNGAVFFAAAAVSGNFQLYSTNGTSGGTGLFLDIYPGNNAFPIGFTRLSNEFIFSAVDAAHGREPWISDGTAGNTRILKDIAADAIPSNAFNFFPFGGKLYFLAENPETGREMWMTDGTEPGTEILADLNEGAGNGIVEFAPIALGDVFFFTVMQSTMGGFSKDRAPQGGAVQREIWVTDGTPEGTEQVADFSVVPGTGSALLRAALAESVLFTVNDGVSGHELWSIHERDAAQDWKQYE